MVLLYRLLRRRHRRAANAARFDAAHPPTRLRWRPKLRLLGLLSGALGGVGSVVLLAQYGVAPVTSRALSERGVAAGAFSGLVLPSAIFALVVWRFNRRLARTGALHPRPRRGPSTPAGRAGAVVALAGAAAALAIAASVQRADALVDGPCRAEFAGVDAAGVTTGAGDAIDVPADGAVTYAMAAPEDLQTWRFSLEYGPFSQLIAEGDRDEPNPNDLGLGLRPEDDFVIDFTGIFGGPVVDGNAIAGKVATDEYAWMGAGLYEVHGEVTTVGGTSCVGVILIDVEGDPLATVLGAAAAGATAIGVAGAGVVALGGLRDGGELLDALDGYDRGLPPGAGDAGDLPADADLGDLADLGGGWWSGGASDNPLTVFDRATGGAGSLSCQGLPDFSVNTAALNLVVEDTVFAYRGLGPPVALRLTHDSAAPPAPSSLGAGWRLSYDAELTVAGGAVAVRKGSGHVERFALAGGDAAARPLDGALDRLTRTGGGWELTEDASDLVLGFAPSADRDLDRWLLVTVADAYANTVRVARGGDGRLESITDAAGRVTRLDTDAGGRVTALTTPDGRVARFEYAGGRLARTVDLAGVATAYAYDDGGRVVRVDVDGGHHVTSVAYTADGAVRAVTDAAGNVTSYEVVGDAPRVVAVTDPSGSTLRYESAGGRTTGVHDGAGVAARFDHDEAGRLARVDAPGGATLLAYDEGGRLASETARGTTTTFAYDASGRLVAEHGPDGELACERDERGEVVRLAGPDGRSLGLERDALGQVVALVDGAGARTAIERDPFGNVVGVTDPTGATTRMRFDAHGLRIEEVTDPNGHTTRYEHDANGRPTRVVHPDGTDRVWTHSCCATVATADAAGRTIRLGRDPLLRVAQEVDASGRATTFEYDPSGLLVRVTDPLGRETRREYDPSGRLVAVVDGAGAAARFEHDGRGLLSAVVDTLGHRTELERDRWGDVVVARESGRRRTMERDAAGRVTRLTNGRGQTVDARYRADGLVSRLETSEGAVVELGYDASGGLVRLSDPTGETALVNDPLGRPVRVVDPSGHEVAVGYDAAGNVASVAYPGGLVVAYERDERDRVRRASWAGGHIELSWDSAGQLVEERRSNGTTTAYRYDLDGAVVALRHDGPGGAFVDLAYERDAAGNVVAVDGVAPLEVAPPAGETASTLGPAGELRAAGDERFELDGDGNVVRAGTWEAAYDAEGRMVGLRRGGAATRLAYDGLGRLAAVEGAGGFRLVRDPLGRPAARLAPDGGVVCRYVWGDGGLLATVTADGSTVFDHHDTTGHLLARTGPSGEVVAAFAHDPFGATVASTGDDDHLFTYCGRHGVIALGEGFYAMGERVYHAPTGRFLQRDPLGLAGGLNPYLYAEANPVSVIDPSGTSGVFEWLDKNLPHDRIKNGFQRAADTFDHYIGSWVRQRVAGLSHPIKAPLRHLERHNRGERVRVTPAQMRRELGQELAGHAEDLVEHVGPPGASGARSALQATRQAADGDFRGAVQTIAAEAEPFLEEHGGVTGETMHQVKEAIDGVGKRADQLRQGVEIYRTCTPGRRSR